METAEAIIVASEKDSWVVYPDDNAYKLVAAMPRGEDGVVRVDARLIHNIKGWWYDKALERVEQALEQYQVPWDELQLTEKEVREAKAQVIAERLVKVAKHMTALSQAVARLEVRVYLAKSALNHAVNKRLAESNSTGAASSKAAIISSNAALREATLDIWETEALRRRLANYLDSLDRIWKTLSRVLSAKLQEPLE